jgi:hypothetical protein
MTNPLYSTAQARSIVPLLDHAERAIEESLQNFSTQCNGYLTTITHARVSIMESINAGTPPSPEVLRTLTKLSLEIQR